MDQAFIEVLVQVPWDEEHDRVICFAAGQDVDSFGEYGGGQSKPTVIKQKEEAERASKLRKLLATRANRRAAGIDR